MKRLLLTLMILFTIIKTSYTQVANYTFSETTGTYTAITLGTQLVTTTGGVTTYDTDGSYFTLAAGNQFTFNSTTITSVIMQADGSLWLNPTTSTTGNGVTGPLASAATAVGIVSAMGMNLRSTSIATQVYERRWYDDGTEDIFQWQNVSRLSQNTVERFSFQIRINKSTGVVRIVYGNMTTIASNTTHQPQVGLRGSVNTDFNNRKLGTATSWGTATSAGTTTGDFLRFRNTSLPASGLIFVWTPPVPCTAPTAQATSYVNSSITSTSITSSFTAASPAPTGYLVVRSSGSLNTNPVNGTTYSAGGTLGNGTIVQVGSSTSISATSLTANTAYTFTIFTYNTGSCTGPTYYTTSPLVGTTTTCLSTPTSNAGSSISTTSFSANWSSVTGATGYILDVATDNAFTSMVSGYSALAIGNVTTYSVTGLSSGTIYYYRVRATGTACTSTNSLTQTITTSCGTYPLTFTQLFNASTTPLCWSTSIVAVQTGTKISYVTSSTSTTVSPQEGTHFIKYNSYSNTNGGSGSEERLITPGVVTTSTSSVDVEFYWYQNNGTSYNSGSYLNEGVTVEWSTNGTTWTTSTFYPRQVSSASSTGEWSKKTITLPAGAGNITTLYVSFKFRSEYGYNLYLDNVVIKPTPGCSEPTLLTSSSITSTDGSISWTAPSSAPSSGYDYYLSTSSTSPISSTTPTGSVGPGVTSVSLTNLSSATQYYFWVRSNCGSSIYSTWAGSSTFTTLIPNDNSGGAIDLTINSSTTCTTTTTGTSIGATQTLVAQSLYGTADDDVWYEFTATEANLNMTVTRGTMGDLVVEGFTSSLVSIGVIDDATGTESISFTNLTIGDVYYVRVYSYSATVGSRGTFTICMTTPTQPPINDEASGAITLIVNDPYINGTNDGATSSTTAPTPNGPSYYGGDVWYKVVVPAGGKVQIRTSAIVLTDIVIEIYSGTFPTLTYIAYNDDSSSVNSMSYLELTGRTAGETIWIRVWDYGGDNTGTFQIRATTPIALPISLLSFTGRNTVDGNLIEWVTASEFNSDYFTLERGLYIDGSVEWLELQYINGAGNSSIMNTYKYFDFDYSDYINYYQLTQTDYDGNSVKYEMISIDNRIKTKEVLSMTNLLGQEINENYRGMIIITYVDGSIETVIK